MALTLQAVLYSPLIKKIAVINRLKQINQDTNSLNNGGGNTILSPISSSYDLSGKVLTGPSYQLENNQINKYVVPLLRPLLSVTKIVRSSAIHNIKVGESEFTNTEMQSKLAALNAPSSGVNIPYISALVLLVLSAAWIVWFFMTHSIN